VSSFTSALERLIALPPYNGQQRTLAEKARIDRGLFSRILNGRQGPTPLIVGRLCAVLDRKQSALLLESYLQSIADQVWEKQGEASGVTGSTESFTQKGQNIAVRYPPVL
jgi:transcriptional regulator with XRE-family HTH domain